MHIDKHWYLNINGRPSLRRYSMTKYCTKKEFDKVSIYYDNSVDFVPIVFSTYTVQSQEVWNVSFFYTGILRCIKVYKEKGTWQWYADRVRYKIVYNVCNYRRFVDWGCREFTIGQLKGIKNLMKEEYTDQQLGVKL